MPPTASRQFSGIFISYRRDDSGGHAGRLFDTLVERFGDDRIFMDVDHIGPGQDFVEILEQALGSCEILLAVIGRHWLSGAGGTSRRLDDPHDFVRLEISTALRRKVHVIPILVEGAVMPSPRDLPGELSPLSRRQAIELRDPRWKHDVTWLIGALEKVLAERQGARHEEEERRRSAEETEPEESAAGEGGREAVESGRREAEEPPGRADTPDRLPASAESSSASASQWYKKGALAAAAVLALVAAGAFIAGLPGLIRSTNEGPSPATSPTPAGTPPEGQQTPGPAPKTSAAELVRLAGGFINREDYDGAIRAATEAITLNPRFADAYMTRGIAYGRKGAHDLSIVDHTEAVRLDPQLMVAFLNRCRAYNDIGNYDRAILDCTEVIRLDPRSADGYLTRGFSYSRKGDAERALNDYTQAIRLDPSFTLAYKNRARVYEHLGQKARAAADWARVAELER